MQIHLDLVVPDVAKQVQHAQITQKNNHDLHSKERQFSPTDQVMVRDYASTPRWMSGQVIAVSSPVSYQVTLANGMQWRRHQDQLHKVTHMTEVQAELDMDFEFNFNTTDSTSASTTPTSQVMDRNVTGSSCYQSSRVRQYPDRLTF